MHSSKAATLATIIAFAFSGSISAQAQQLSAPELTVAEKIEMAERINDEKMRSALAAQESERLEAENEVVRMQIQSRDLISQRDTSLSEIEQMRQELQRYKRLLANSSTTAQRAEKTESPRSQSQPPLNMRLLNVLKGEGITTRARVVVLGDDGSSQGEFQVKEGSSIQGWAIDSINQNTIEVSKNGESYTYGSDGMM